MTNIIQGRLSEARLSNFASSVSMSLAVMTFNLHRDGGSEGPNSWEHRRDICATVINNFSPVVICTQEGLKSQLDDLAAALPGYEQFGMSRKGSLDPSEEHTAILYSRDKVEKMDGGTFWLSETPEVPDSKSWGTNTSSIATWVTFQLKGIQHPGFAFQVVSTHLDANSSLARRRAAFLIWQHIATLPPSLPVIFCGTFNTVKESNTGRFLLGRSREGGVAGDLRDGWASARRRRNSSVVYTNHGFKGSPSKKSHRNQLDIIHLASGAEWGFDVPGSNFSLYDAALALLCGRGGEKRGALHILKLIFMAFCLCWDRQNQDLHLDWILYRGRSLAPLYGEIVVDNIDGCYPSDHYPMYIKFILPRSVVRMEELN